MSSKVGDIIDVFGRPGRVIARTPIYDPETGELSYFALRTEPVKADDPNGTEISPRP